MTTVQPSTLPACDELQTLEDHFDILEGDDGLMSHVLSTNNQSSHLYGNDTPLSTTSGYTSDGSAYSPQKQRTNLDDMSFCRMDSSELMELVSELPIDQSTTNGAAGTSQAFASKIIKGKTSRYRGVTQTSKTSWGAKYSSKRITNTCKTPEEAARAYDEYLKVHHPDKFGKYANFCDVCGNFVNPLQLPEFHSECECGGGSPQTDVESPLQSPTDDEMKGELRFSNLSFGSFKLSFGDELLADADVTRDVEDVRVKDEPMEHRPLEKKDSLPLAVIGSAFEAFCKDPEIDGLLPMEEETQPRKAAHNQNHDPMQSTYHKAHSLDFDLSQTSSAATTSASSGNDVVVSSYSNQAPYAVQINISTGFLPKYWRNDRKNLQCFPVCPEHGNYYVLRMNNLKHVSKGVCRAPVGAQICIYTNDVIDEESFVALARCNARQIREFRDIFTQSTLAKPQYHELEKLSTPTKILKNEQASKDGVQVFDAHFYPDVWKFECDLPKKRRNAGDESDGSSSECQYFLEIDLFFTADKESYHRTGYVQSSPFQIANTRTLLRQRNRTAGDVGHPDTHVADDELAGDMPGKKKVKTHYLQRAQEIPGEELTEDATETINEKPGYERFNSPRKAGQNRSREVHQASKTMCSTFCDAPCETSPEVDEEKQSNSSGCSLFKLVGYSLFSLPLSIVFVPVGLLLLVGFLVVPFLGGTLARVLDTMSDVELRNANRVIIANEKRYELNRVYLGPVSMFRHHQEKTTWTRLLYFCGIKALITACTVVPALVIVFVGLVTYPAKAISGPILHGASRTMLISREYTRVTVGKPRLQGNCIQAADAV